MRGVPIKLKFDEIIRSALETDENVNISDDVQLLRTGTFRHPNFGEISVTKAMLESMVVNFDNKVRGIDIAIVCDSIHMIGGPPNDHAS